MLYVSFGSKVRPRTFGSDVKRVQVVLSGFSKRLFCFVQAKTVYMYFLAALVLVCVDVIVMSSA